MKCHSRVLFTHKVAIVLLGIADRMHYIELILLPTIIALIISYSQKWTGDLWPLTIKDFSQVSAELSLLTPSLHEDYKHSWPGLPSGMTGAPRTLYSWWGGWPQSSYCILYSWLRRWHLTLYSRGTNLSRKVNLESFSQLTLAIIDVSWCLTCRRRENVIGGFDNVVVE